MPWVTMVPRFAKPKVAAFSREYQWLRSDDEIRRFLAAARAEDEHVFVFYTAAPVNMPGLRLSARTQRPRRGALTLASTCQIWHMLCGVPIPDKTLVILSGEIKTPPLSKQARIEAGVLLRRLQRGEVLTMPHSRPMPVVGPRCHELRIPDPATSQTWRILYRTDPREILVVEVFSKKTQQTPRQVVDTCIRRLREWDAE